MARIYELYELLFFTKQNGKLVNEFLATKKVMWEKLIVISGEDAPTTESTETVQRKLTRRSTKTTRRREEDIPK